MNSLLELQRTVQASVVSQTPQPEVFAGDRAAKAGRLGIHIRGYQARLVEALRTNYPVLHRVLGDDAFGAMAHAYIAASPSIHRSIRWFGGELAEFLGREPTLLPHPALLDLVDMEWAIGSAFDAPDSVPIVAEEVAGVAPEQWFALRFSLHPSARLLELQWAVEPVWQAVKADENTGTPEPEHGPHALLVWRHALEARWRSLEPQEAMLLGLLAQGQTFGSLCDHLAAGAEERGAAELAACMLRRWISHQLLVCAEARGQMP